MIKAYLNIQKIRMDERLNYKIDVPDNLWQYSFPPMLLQPLVENAIKHGLEPKVEGGAIVIRATQENNILKIEVAITAWDFLISINLVLVLLMCGNALVCFSEKKDD